MPRSERRRFILAGATALAGGFGGAWVMAGRRPGMTFTDRGLEALKMTVADHVAQGAAPAVVGLVRRGDETHVFPAGEARRDSIFRLASMTKPVTAVAAMMLVEDGKLSLDEPIDRLAPELADRRVLKRLDGPLDETVPANRPITLEDVLTFRLGWGIDFNPDLPINKAVADLPGFGMPNPASPITPDQFMARLGALPLMAQPGERWLYTLGSNVLGVLIARAAGKPLDAVFQERIFAPLGMVDTGFHVPPEKLGRFVTGYVNEGGKLTVYDPPHGLYARPPAFPAGDSGLVATADDFGRFAAFLTTGLAPDGNRLLSEATLKAMKTDRLTPAQRKGGEDILGPARGFGYGLGVTLPGNPYGIAAGSYGWDGGFGTSWFNDPGKDLTVLLLTQRFFDSPDPPPIHKAFWKEAYEALA